jgi:hypothetical protein
MDCLALPAFTLKMKGTSKPLLEQNCFHRASWLQYLQLWDLGRFLVAIHTTCIRQQGSWSCFLHWNVFKTMHPRTVCALLLHPTLLIPTLFMTCSLQKSEMRVPKVHPYHVDPCRTRASRGRNEFSHAPFVSARRCFARLLSFESRRQVLVEFFRAMRNMISYVGLSENVVYP